MFNSTFIGRAGATSKGKISRYLANKCAIASRIDCFSEFPTAKIGESLRDQVEERLKFISSGAKPRKNKEAMESVLNELKEEGLFFGDNPKKVEATADDGVEANEAETDEEVVEKKSKKSKKEKKDKKSSSKKRKRSDVGEDEDDEDAEALKEAAKIKKRKKTK